MLSDDVILFKTEFAVGLRNRMKRLIKNVFSVALIVGRRNREGERD